MIGNPRIKCPRYRAESDHVGVNPGSLSAKKRVNNEDQADKGLRKLHAHVRVVLAATALRIVRVLREVFNVGGDSHQFSPATRFSGGLGAPIIPVNLHRKPLLPAAGR